MAKKKKATQKEVVNSAEAVVEPVEETVEVTNEEIVLHEITQEDLDENPELVERGLEVGEAVELGEETDKDGKIWTRDHRELLKVEGSRQDLRGNEYYGVKA